MSRTKVRRITNDMDSLINNMSKLIEPDLPKRSKKDAPFIAQDFIVEDFMKNQSRKPRKNRRNEFSITGF